MRLKDLNALDAVSAERELLRCCGSTRWAQSMADARPFDSADHVAATADAVWQALGEADWLEAFEAHPRIGDPRTGESGESGGAGDAGWAQQEQSGLRSASDQVRERLAAGNQQYEARFGYIFIVCATGRTAEEMLGLLEGRLQHTPHQELRAGAEEQRQITRLRLAKLFEPEGR